MDIHVHVLFIYYDIVVYMYMYGIVYGWNSDRKEVVSSALPHPLSLYLSLSLSLLLFYV